MNKLTLRGVVAVLVIPQIILMLIYGLSQDQTQNFLNTLIHRVIAFIDNNAAVPLQVALANGLGWFTLSFAFAVISLCVCVNWNSSIEDEINKQFRDISATAAFDAMEREYRRSRACRHVGVYTLAAYALGAVLTVMMGLPVSETVPSSTAILSIVFAILAAMMFDGAVPEEPTERMKRAIRRAEFDIYQGYKWKMALGTPAIDSIFVRELVQAHLDKKLQNEEWRNDFKAYEKRMREA